MKSTTKQADVLVTSKGFMGLLERSANKIPHPGLIFFWLSVIVMLISLLLSKMGVSVVNPSTEETISVVNLLSADFIANFLKDMGSTFATFSPMLTVLLVTLGLGVSNQSGLLHNTLKLVGKSSKNKFVLTFMVAFVGVMGNLAGDVAALVLPSLCAVLFYGVGRNPVAGLLLSLSASGVGFGANLIVGSGDVTLSGLTGAAAALLDPTFEASPAMGWYFMAVSTPILSLILTIVDLKWVEPKLDRMQVATNYHEEVEEGALDALAVSDAERAGLKSALLGLLGVVAVWVIMCLPGMPLAAPEGGSLFDGTLLKSITAFLFFMFLIPGWLYGRKVGKIKNFKDVAKFMGDELKTLAPFFVISFFASEFMYIFSASNLAQIIAVKGGELIGASGLSGSFVLVLVVVVVCLINFFIPSSAAKWALLAPIFVPMLMVIGISPAAAQTAYRIGDGMSNSLTPVSPNIIVNLTYAQKYDDRIQLGTMFANLIPLNIVVGIVWALMLYVWCQLGLPLGPGYVPFL